MFDKKVSNDFKAVAVATTEFAVGQISTVPTIEQFSALAFSFSCALSLFIQM